MAKSKAQVFPDQRAAEEKKDADENRVRSINSEAADNIASMDLDEWMELHGHRIAEQNPGRTQRRARRRNADHPDAAHPVEVSRYWRSGGASQWQRAHREGQQPLFEHGIKIRNPSAALKTLRALGLSRKEAQQILEQLTRRKPSERKKIMPASKGDLLDALQSVADILDPFIAAGDIELESESEDEDETDEE